MAFFRPAPRRRFPALTSGPNCTKLGFPVLLQAIPPESSVGNGKTPLLADWRGFGRFWRFFGWLQDDAALRLPLDRIAPNSVLGLLQAIPPESSVRNGKIPVSADYPNFAPWSNFWRFFGRLQDDAFLRLPLDRIAPNSVSCALAGHST